MSHELSITRLIDAPVDAVWRAWTNDTGAWFCPRPWTAEFVTQEMVSGGRSVIVMRGPNGEENRLEGVYLEVAPGKRIVSTDAFTAGWHPAGPFMVRIDDFAEEDGRTRYTATARHWTAEAKESHAAMGFEAGWNAATDQLEAIALRLGAGHSSACVRMIRAAKPDCLRATHALAARISAPRPCSGWRRMWDERGLQRPSRRVAGREGFSTKGDLCGKPRPPASPPPLPVPGRIGGQANAGAWRSC